ncbi:hypothetical protein Q3G72_024367 [Acer saccharum]|nr:hypothetical protein Q3G72_024367 [Acer saccharum]
MFHLDLSDNRIPGEIPNWIWEVGNGHLVHLNLSRNLLVSLREPYFIPDLSVLDLHCNQLQGKIPNTPPNALYVDYSSNNFISSIPTDIERDVSWPQLQIFDLASNNFTGKLIQKGLKTWEAMMVDEGKAQPQLEHLRFEFMGLSQLYYRDAVTVTSKGNEGLYGPPLTNDDRTTNLYDDGTTNLSELPAASSNEFEFDWQFIIAIGAGFGNIFSSAAVFFYFPVYTVGLVAKMCNMHDKQLSGSQQFNYN